VEYQLRRPVLRELGMNDMDAFFNGLQHLWAYCTEKWLKFQSNPGKHHTQKKTLPWWQTVQSSYLGLQDGEPLTRAKAIANDTKKLRKQFTGLGTGILALEHEAKNQDEALDVCFDDFTEAAGDAVHQLGKTDDDLMEDIEKKLCKRKRLKKKYDQATLQRERLGLYRKGLGGKQWVNPSGCSRSNRLPISSACIGQRCRA
jgi:hypothetical protein